MPRSPLRFNLYWGWLLIFLGSHENQVADPMIEAQNSSMKIGYCRVSTDDQNPDLQLTALKRAGCKRTFTDKASGAHVKRLHLTKCLASLQAGDVLIVWKLD